MDEEDETSWTAYSFQEGFDHFHAMINEVS